MEKKKINEKPGMTVMINGQKTCSIDGGMHLNIYCRSGERKVTDIKKGEKE